MFSPGFAFSLSILGFHSLATMVSSGDTDNQSLSIYIRIFIFFVVVIAFFRVAPRPYKPLTHQFLPGTVFLFLYTTRLLENIYLSGIDVGNGSAVVLGIFLFSGVIPAYALSLRYRGIKDEDFVPAAVILLLCAAAGMILNRDALLDSATGRMAMDRINPIALGHLGFAYVIFFVVTFKRSLSIKLLSVFSIPLLALVIVYTRSRGPYLAGAGALMLYVLLLKGTRRVWLLFGLGLAVLVIAFVASPDLVDIVTTQLSRTDVNSDMSNQMRVIAFTGAWNQFLDHFLIGRYVVELQTGYYPHNIYLESLMSVGIIGSIPFAMHVMFAIRSAVGIIRDPRSTIWATFAALLFFREALGSFVSGGIWGATGFWISSFLIIAVWHGGFPAVQHRPFMNAVQARGRSAMRTVP
ncbi:hypothetical protein X759_28830 [Mesorhizobium sp. LSHC420B00]|nr:hypothetical protein X759_28830 [Mesorhizobium sp. LSHC420B00]